MRAQFCPACGTDLFALERAAEDTGPTPVASSGELLRSLLEIATLRPPRSKQPSGDAWAWAGTQVYGDETGPARVDAKPASAGNPLRVPPADARPEVPGAWLLTLDEAEAVLCARVQTDPHASKRIVDLLCLVAAADGEVDADERKALSRTLAVLLGSELHPAMLEVLIRGSLHEIESQGFDARILDVAASMRACSAVEEGLLVAIAMAYVSDGFSGPERDVIQGLARAMGIGAPRLAALVRRVRSEVDPG